MLGFIGIGVSVLLTPQLKSWAHTFLMPGAEKVVIVSKNSEFTKICTVLDEPNAPENCEDISNQDAEALTYVGMEHVAWKSRFPIEFFDYWWVFVFPAFFVLLDFRRDVSRAVRRFVRLARQ